MPPRRRPPGVGVKVPLLSEDEYFEALAELERLKMKPLGTPATEGLQDLIEAILDWEAENGEGQAGMTMQ